MTSDWATVIDAIATDLTGSGKPLAGAETHKYGLWDPENLTVEQPGVRSVGIWANGSANIPEQATAGPIGGTHMHGQQYTVLVWERAIQEGERLKRDETSDLAWLQLENDVRARFYVNANQSLGGSVRLWWVSTEFPADIGQVRWFAITVQALRQQAFTAS